MYVRYSKTKVKTNYQEGFPRCLGAHSCIFVVFCNDFPTFYMASTFRAALSRYGGVALEAERVFFVCQYCILALTIMVLIYQFISLYINISFCLKCFSNTNLMMGTVLINSNSIKNRLSSFIISLSTMFCGPFIKFPARPHVCQVKLINLHAKTWPHAVFDLLQVVNKQGASISRTYKQHNSMIILAYENNLKHACYTCEK